jgi:hypothetical protein
MKRRCLPLALLGVASSISHAGVGGGAGEFHDAMERYGPEGADLRSCIWSATSWRA